MTTGVLCCFPFQPLGVQGRWAEGLCGVLGVAVVAVAIELGPGKFEP